MKELTDTDFATELAAATTPVFIDFYADWCMPCKMITPTLEKLEGEYAGKVTFFKVNADTARETFLAHGVASIPTMVIYKDGVVAHKMVGLKSESDLKTELDNVTF